MKEGVIDISPLSLTLECIPLKSQLFEGSNSYQTPHRGQTLGFVSRSLTPSTQRKPKLCFTGFSKCPWGKHSCYSPYFLVPASIQCIFCPGHYLLSCQLILHLRRLFLILSRYFSCFQYEGQPGYLALCITKLQYWGHTQYSSSVPTTS